MSTKENEMPSERPTPITDESVKDLWNGIRQHERVADLERQLADARAECEEQARLLGMSGSREAKLIAERDALAGALEWVSSHAYAGSKRFGDVEPVKSALAAVKGGQGE